MNELPFAPFQTSCYNICTQKHGPWNHSDMIALQAPCKGGSLQGGMTRDKDENMQAPSPESRHLQQSCNPLVSKVSNKTEDNILGKQP